MAKCSHPKDQQTIVIVYATCGCETTRVQCQVCKEYLTKPKTDC